VHVPNEPPHAPPFATHVSFTQQEPAVVHVEFWQQG